MKYIVYCTINKQNGKYYIGVHQTETPFIFDGYLGNGIYIDNPSTYQHGKCPIHKAVTKYGIKSFYRVTLGVFDTKEEALDIENKLVSSEFIKQTCNYNATIGGGKPPLLTRSVYQFTIKGEFVKEWNSETEINKYYNTKVNFSDIINSKRTFAGYIWNFENSVNVDEYKFENNHGFISQYSLNGDLLNTFNNTTIAAQKLDLDRRAITQAVFKKKAYFGFYFLKSDVDISEVISDKFKNTTNKRPIYRYLVSGEFDKEYESTVKAIRDTPKTHSSTLKNAVVDGRLCGGYRWSYQKANNYFDLSNPNLYTKPTKVLQYTLDGEFVKEWDIKDCKKEFRYCLRVCRGELKSTQGFKFMFKEIKDIV